MKIILSRKGFDSTMGGYPSPIFNNKMVSMPIPEKNSSHRYDELQIDYNLGTQNFAPLLYTNFDFKRTCHFDPDINKAMLKNRPKNWKALFGQTGSAQTHLQNQGVKENDIFLFFGWFRHTEKITNKIIFTGPDMHVIFGYFQIGEILKIKDIQLDKWMKYHPHIQNEEYKNDNLNTLYVAKEKLSFDKNLLGAGAFDYNKKLVLTKKSYTRSRWNFPEIFKSVNITCHPNPWKISKETGEEYFQSACIGQEFVIKENGGIEEWAKKLINLMV
ncbi:hypothetical protein KAI65_00630 [Candidatus Parcubacteria bacterium]|nr:hypothetical protein [Candidatus Parcubacteria bacterium]